MSIKLIRATVEDAKIITEMQKIAFMALLEKYKDYQTNPAAEELARVQERLLYKNTDCFFIVANTVRVGCLRIEHSELSCVLKQIFILPQYRHKGYAQEAILFAENLYTQKVWKLDTIKQEEWLCRFYEKLGYKQTGKEQKISDDMTLVFYQKYYE